MRKTIAILLAVCAVTFAAATKKATLSFTNGVPLHVTSRTVTKCTTDAFTWADAPCASFAWNVYGQAGVRYCVGLQWSDALHFDSRIDTILYDTIPAGATTRSTAIRRVEEFARPVSVNGRAIVMRDTAGDTLSGAVYVDSANLVPDER